MQTRSLSRSWASPLLTLALLLAACGGQSDTELATIDDGIERVGDDVDAGGPDEPTAAIIETVDRSDDDDDADADLPVPEAVEPAPPGAAFSPAQRQQQQELGLVASSEPEAPDVVIPGVSGVEAPAGAARSEVAPSVGRADLDQFPDTIPATVPGAPQGPGAANPDSGTFADGGSGTPNSFPAVVSEPIIEAADAAGVVPESDAVQSAPVIESDNLVVEPEFESEIEECSASDCVVPGDIASMEGDGIGDAAGAGQSQDGDAGEDGVSAVCAARPYARGCALPVPEVIDYFDEAGDDDDADVDLATSGGDESADDEEGGVFVSQDVLDALLGPADNDPTAGNGAEDDEATDEPAADDGPASSDDGAPTSSEGNAASPNGTLDP